MQPVLKAIQGMKLPLDRLEIQHQIGQGGFGVVHKGRCGPVFMCAGGPGVCGGQACVEQEGAHPVGCVT